MEDNRTASASLPFTDCRQFDGDPAAFWECFGEALVASTGGSRALFLKWEPSPDSAIEGSWKPFARCPNTETGPFPLPLKLGDERFAALAASAFNEGIATLAGTSDSLIALHLLTRPDQPDMLALVSAPRHESGEHLLSAQDVVLSYENHRLAAQSREESEAVTRVLEALSVINLSEHFVEASMALCNEVAERFQCERVSLGWSDGRYIRLKAVSGMDQVVSKMDAVQQMESCLEEATDQECAVKFPAPAGSRTIIRAHQAFATTNSSRGSLVSVPFTTGRDSGGIFLEKDGEIPLSDINALRVLADQAAPRLSALKREERWVGALLANRARRVFARLLGPEHTWTKVAAVVGTLVLAFLLFFPWQYKIEAEFIVRSEGLQHLPAPYDGYIQTVNNRVGDEVGNGDVLLALDTGQLRLEEASALASIQRYQGEAQKAESEGRLADMLVSQSLAQQASASLEMARHRIAQAELRAPIDGVLVAGDFRDKIGAPVKTGDVLLRLTRLEDLYLEMKIEERDIDEIGSGDTARIAFASRPGTRYDVSVERIEPVAVTETAGNVFVARGDFEVTPETWWRPGMTGVAKIDAGTRSPLWVMTHRLVDFLRLKLWL